MHHAELSDEQLAALAAREASSGPAFQQLLERYRQRVWRICYRLMGHEHDAQDAAQEVFVRLFLHRGRYAQASKYSTWVHGVAVRTCLGLRRCRGRRQRRVALVGDEALQHSAAARSAASGAALDVATLLEALDETDRALVLLKYAEDYSYEELAEIFSLSVSACKMRVSRARDKLQRRHPDERSPTAGDATP